MVDWTKDAVEALISSTKEQTVLYDTTNKLYHNKNARTAALESVASQVSFVKPVTADECRIKFQSLRSHYGAECNKVKSSRKSGAGREDVYSPSVWWYQQMRFLEPYVRSRKSRSNIFSCIDPTVTGRVLDSNDHESATINFPVISLPEHMPDCEVVSHDREVVTINVPFTSLPEHMPDCEVVSHDPELVTINFPGTSLSEHMPDCEVVSHDREVVTINVPGTSLSEHVPDSQDCVAVMMNASSCARSPYERTKKRKKTEDALLSEALTAMSEVNTRMKNPIQSDVQDFCKFMGSQLGSITDERIKISAMREIIKVMWEKEEFLDKNK